MVQWLRQHASTTGGTGSIPGWGSSACHEVRPKKKKKNSVVCTKLIISLDLGFSSPPGRYLGFPGVVRLVVNCLSPRHSNFAVVSSVFFILVG